MYWANAIMYCGPKGKSTCFVKSLVWSLMPHSPLVHIWKQLLSTYLKAVWVWAHINLCNHLMNVVYVSGSTLKHYSQFYLIPTATKVCRLIPYKEIEFVICLNSQNRWYSWKWNDRNDSKAQILKIYLFLTESPWDT